MVRCVGRLVDQGHGGVDERGLEQISEAEMCVAFWLNGRSNENRVAVVMMRESWSVIVKLSRC